MKIQDIIDAQEPCDLCGGALGRNFSLCDPCFGFYCVNCIDRHNLEIHIGPKERATLAQWREQAKARGR